jgi:hypothetical protein
MAVCKILDRNVSRSDPPITTDKVKKRSEKMIFKFNPFCPIIPNFYHEEPSFSLCFDQ